MSEKTVEINGTIYDKHTGMPIRRTEKAPPSQRSHAGALHQKTQRSSTLNRTYVHRAIPVAERKQIQAKPATAAKRIQVTSGNHQRSPMIQKYAKHPTPPQKKVSQDVIAAPAIHPMVQQVHAAKAAKQPVQRTRKPSDIIKTEAIQSALDSAPKKQRSPRREKSNVRSKKQRFNRALSFASSGVALLMIAGYFTYMNMPNLSVRVAAVQAGVDASYPNYRPSGYSLAGPITYDDNKVAMSFGSNGTSDNFILTQTRSGWDSTAVLENYVVPKVGHNYITTASGGLTIYSWNGNAAWVNDGILHTIEGTAPLTPNQLGRVAASM